MKAIKILSFYVAIAATSGCVTTPPSEPLSNYEILPIPKQSNFYRPGTLWIHGIGPDGNSFGEVLTSDGLSNLNQTIAHNLKSELSASLKKRISSAIGIQSSLIQTINLTDLTHRRVMEVRDTRAIGDIIWETIEASKISINFTEGSDVTINSNTEQELSDALGASNVTISNQEGSTYTADANDPLVFALRVVNLDYEVESGFLELDSPEQYLGYRLNRTRSDDILTQKTYVNISNNMIVGWPGVNTELTANEVWINSDVRSTIPLEEKYEDANFVWDSFLLHWPLPRRVFISRQYGFISPSKTGF